jgi:hypothetical protein
LGLAFHNYHDHHKRLPAASGITRNADEHITAVDGWSFLVHLLPFMERAKLYESIDIENGRPLDKADAAQHGPNSRLRATVLGELACPSYAGGRYADAKHMDAITNYKAMGASHHESLSAASPRPLTPKYPKGASAEFYRPQKSYHPDGACFPGAEVRLIDMAMDGTSHTILAVETIEPCFARWAVGGDASLVGLPSYVEYEPWELGGGYYAPKGYNGRFGCSSTVEASYCTYMNSDCAKSPYDGADGAVAGRYGPSSAHPKVVNHLMADGSCKSYIRDFDVARWAGVVADLQDLAVLDQHFYGFPQTHSIIRDRLPVLRRLPSLAGHGNHDRILVYIQTDVNHTRTHWTSPPVCGSVVKGCLSTTL